MYHNKEEDTKKCQNVFPLISIWKTSENTVFTMTMTCYAASHVQNGLTMNGKTTLPKAA